jgi:ubiquinone/menaquinone biosynthesis C-methylase UbiE
MKLSTAVSLIEKGITSRPSQHWADLGAGSGLFTRALLEVVGPGSTVYAVDKNISGLSPISDEENVTAIKLDFTNGLGEISKLDGILMANSLHFVNDKVSLLNQLSLHLKPAGRFIIVEYNTDQSNTWVPYPVSLGNLIALVRDNKIGAIEKIGEADSAYQRGGMYSAMITVRTAD